MAKGADLTIVVGDPKSNNTNRLVQVAEELAGSPAIRIETVADLTPEMLAGKRRVAVTAGASTPSQLTRQVIQYVESLGAKAREVTLDAPEDAPIPRGAAAAVGGGATQPAPGRS
jgi:4-hydroxy-3-methylbut-2-enyl diphosphate reductase